MAERGYMAHVARGGELLRADRVLEARRELEQARAIRPGDPRILNLLGLTYFRLGMYPEASAIYRGLVAKSPRDASLRINLGLVHLKLGAVDEALVCLEEASALDPEHQRAAAYLGLALARKGEYRRARDAFIRAGQGELAREMQSHADRGTRQSGPHSGVADDDDLYPPIVVVEESAPTNGASSPVVSRRPQAVKTLTMPRFAEAPTRLPEHVGVRTPARGTVLPGDARYPAVPPMASAVPRPIAAEQTAPSPPPVVMERSAPMAAVRPV
ncbi:MAG: tetratricopeptide repeat protein, partial [Myxococcales bacterium]|nr:tetratricopeptide repeat protein [Myxococcales bacterium]